MKQLGTMVGIEVGIRAGQGASWWQLCPGLESSCVRFCQGMPWQMYAKVLQKQTPSAVAAPFMAYEAVLPWVTCIIKHIREQAAYCCSAIIAY